MIKGISINSSISDFDNIPLPNFDHFYQAQDTIKTSIPAQQQDIAPAPSNNSDSNTVSSQPQNKVTSQQTKTIIQQQERTTQDTVYVFKGSVSRVFDYYPSLTTSDQGNENLNSNVIANIGERSFFGAPLAPLPQIDTTKEKANITTTVQAPKKPEITGIEGDKLKNTSYDWYTLILLIAIAIFAWGKSLYHKYLLQIITSVYNYQISIQLFRDKNALFRNLSIILQVLYPISFGLLIFTLINHFHQKQVFNYALANIATYSFGVFLFFQFKTMLYKFIGLVFKVEEDFHEIQHHQNIFNQTIGIFLLPFLISIPFLDERLKSIAIIGLFLLAGATLLLFFYRGFQVVTRKQVSIFFLILYLCAVEILPIVLVIKSSNSII